MLINQLKQIEEICIRLFAMYSQMAIDHAKNKYVADSIYRLAKQEQRNIRSLDVMLSTLKADNEANRKAYNEALYILNVYKCIDKNRERI